MTSFQIKTPEAEYDWGAVVNFKKVQEAIPGRKNKQGQTKMQTKVKVDILLHVIPSENENGDSIPKPCREDQVSGTRDALYIKKCFCFVASNIAPTYSPYLHILLFH